MQLIIFRREDVLDIEVNASGFTKQMEKDLLTGMGLGNDEESDNEEETDEEHNKNSEDIELEELRFKIEQTLLEDAMKAPNLSILHIQSIKSDNTTIDDVEDSTLNTNESTENFDGNTSIVADSEIHSISTTSTIAPEVIRSRVKKALEKRDRMVMKQRCLAKGEASAVTRQRRENRDTIQDHKGFCGWD